ncbi:hypothetical protein Q5H91_03955 [Sphingomonas sp. KR1UV-12]|uniref:Uncharacterized protein n=1 Tax=Sphingomonas aurea TaxID=3063994 RepID=A0ABT9EHU7_9SPHN|nr:hypothetical protein [Sphingomonas sp. KR1UV-12]MDP1026356.1 hypothetical protein [Sphingomonas sp. KR1UV-12]
MADPHPNADCDTIQRAVIENINADAAAGIAPGLMTDVYVAIDTPDEVDDTEGCSDE